MQAMLWFIERAFPKVPKMFIIYPELEATNDYGNLSSKKAKDQIVEMKVERINQKSQ